MRLAAVKNAHRWVDPEVFADSKLKLRLPAGIATPRVQRQGVFNSLFEACPMGVTISRLRDGRFMEANEAFLQCFGYQRAAVIGKTALEVMPWADSHQCQGLMEGLNKNGCVDDYPVRLRSRTGEVRDYAVFARLLAFNGDALFMLMFFDITEKRVADEEMARLAFYDELTRLPNRRLLMERLQQVLITNTRTHHFGALMFLDLDNFKHLNDSNGHHAGDLLLRSMGQRLQSCVREQDTVARLGGDEFVVLLVDLGDAPDLAKAQAVQVVGKILQRLNRPYQLGDIEYLCSPSVGLTLFRGKEEAADDVFKRADLAMYQAKADGKNTYRFVDLLAAGQLRAT